MAKTYGVFLILLASVAFSSSSTVMRRFKAARVSGAGLSDMWMNLEIL